MLTAQAAMAAITLAAGLVACLPLPQLFTLAILAYQGVIQLSVPLYLGIFTRIGNRQGAIGGMLAGIATVAVLEIRWPGAIPWAYGLTSGVIALAVNLAVYLTGPSRREALGRRSGPAQGPLRRCRGASAAGCTTHGNPGRGLTAPSDFGRISDP